MGRKRRLPEIKQYDTEFNGVRFKGVELRMTPANLRKYAERIAKTATRFGEVRVYMQNDDFDAYIFPFPADVSTLPSQYYHYGDITVSLYHGRIECITPTGFVPLISHPRYHFVIERKYDLHSSGKELVDYLKHFQNEAHLSLVLVGTCGNRVKIRRSEYTVIDIDERTIEPILPDFMKHQLFVNIGKLRDITTGVWGGVALGPIPSCISSMITVTSKNLGWHSASRHPNVTYRFFEGNYWKSIDPFIRNRARYALCKEEDRDALIGKSPACLLGFDLIARLWSTLMIYDF
jgi:hypothetical protein